MAVHEILQLGNPILRTPCARVRHFGDAELRPLADDLLDTLRDFRTRNGFGRGIAAPQCGANRRMIVIESGGVTVLVNPEIVRRSRRKMTLWDDCFSFPDLAVKVKRNVSVEVRYQDMTGHSHRIHAEGALSELLQHEIDHLDGILAIDRAIDSHHIVYRKELERKNHEAEPVML